jgi:hypothetical protein
VKTLKGKVVEYQMHPDRDRGRSGRYQGRVVRVLMFKRTGRVRLVTVQGPDYDAGKFNWMGAKRVIRGDQITGVLYRRKLRPLTEFENHSCNRV